MNFKNLEPKDFYFYVGETIIHSEYEEPETLISICPIVFFETNGYCYDQYLGIDRFLPDSIAECRESIFSTILNSEDARQVMLKLGFVENKKFSEFCSNHNPFV